MRSELLLMGLVPLRKRIPRALLPFPPWTRPEDDHLWTRQWVLTRHQICWHLDLRLLDFRTMEIKYLLFLRHSVFGILLQQSRWTKTYIFFFFLLMLAKNQLLTHIDYACDYQSMLRFQNAALVIPGGWKGPRKNDVYVWAANDSVHMSAFKF